MNTEPENNPLRDQNNAKNLPLFNPEHNYVRSIEYRHSKLTILPMKEEFGRLEFYKAAMVSVKSESSFKFDTRGMGVSRTREYLIDKIKIAGRDLVECKWDYIVIELWIGEGIDPTIVGHSDYWLRFEDNLGEWVPCGKPKEFIGIVDWTA